MKVADCPASSFSGAPTGRAGSYVNRVSPATLTTVYGTVSRTTCDESLLRVG